MDRHSQQPLQKVIISYHDASTFHLEHVLLYEIHVFHIVKLSQ